MFSQYWYYISQKPSLFVSDFYLVYLSDVQEMILLKANKQFLIYGLADHLINVSVTFIFLNILMSSLSRYTMSVTG